MTTPDAPLARVSADADLVPLKFLVPRAWRTQLQDAAAVQGISMADLCRLVLRGFLRNRHPDETRAVLEGR